MIEIRYPPGIKMLRATNDCGLNFYGEKMILGIQKTGGIHQSQMADVLKATVRWADQLIVKDITIF